MSNHPVSIEIEPPSQMSEAHPGIAAQVQPKKSGLRKTLLAGAGLVALAGAAWFGWDYWTVGRFQVSTDDAYVEADNPTVAPKVSGYLSAVLVDDNQPVTAGQVLARIDDRDFRTALDQVGCQPRGRLWGRFQLVEASASRNLGWIAA